METLERVNTKINAALITREVDTDVVTARAEQMPNTCSVTGLLAMIGSVRGRGNLLISIPPNPIAQDRGRRHQAQARNA